METRADESTGTTNVIIEESRSTIKSCRCGRGESGDNVKCVRIKLDGLHKARRIRCPCFQAKQKCTDKCKCKTCGNRLVGQRNKENDKPIIKQFNKDRYSYTSNRVGSKNMAAWIRDNLPGSGQRKEENRGMNALEVFTIITIVKQLGVDVSEKCILNRYNALCEFLSGVLLLNPLTFITLDILSRTLQQIKKYKDWLHDL